MLNVVPATQALFAVAQEHHQAGRLAEAEAAYRQVLAHHPEHADALHFLGLLACQTQHDSSGVTFMRQAIVIKPDNATFHNNLGVALKNLGQLNEAMDCYRHALALEPDMAEANNNLANAMRDVGQSEEAIGHYRRALARLPGWAQASSNLGNALWDIGRLDEALACYRHALELNPSLAQVHSGLVMAQHYRPEMDARKIGEEARLWGERHAAPLAGHVLPHANDPSPNRRLRIGYVSADFKEHASLLFLDPLLRSHDPAQVEIFCYAEVAGPDAMTARFKSMGHAWRDTAGLSDDQVADQIRRDAIDILVDLKLHTDLNRLLVFARKPAPVQVTWLGYPGTTGLRAMDYRFTDPYLDPPDCDTTVYSEESVRLPETFWCYSALGAQIGVNPLPALAAGHVTFGSLNNFRKINVPTLQRWAQVLLAVGTSRLLMMAPEGSLGPMFRQTFASQGVDPGRIDFMAKRSRQVYLEAFHRIDIGLDPSPCNGHTTSLDSFWMGVPVITLVGQTVVGRSGLSQLMNLRLPELIAQTPEAFVRIATGFAGDLPRLAALRASLRQRMEASPLMDAPRFARNMEAAYRAIWRRWCITRS